MFKDRLKQARLNRGMTQSELAERIGVVKSTVAGYETGRSEPNMEKFAQIMAVLRTDANALLRDEMESAQGGASAISDEAMLIAEKYDLLDGHGKHVVKIVLEAEAARAEDE